MQFLKPRASGVGREADDAAPSSWQVSLVIWDGWRHSDQENECIAKKTNFGYGELVVRESLGGFEVVDVLHVRGRRHLIL